MIKFVRRWWWVPVVAVVVVIAAIAAVRENDPAEDIHPARMDRFDVLVADRDCRALQDEFDRSDDTAELRYLDNALERIGCYG